MTTQQTIYALPRFSGDLSSCIWYHALDLPEGAVSGQWDLRGRFDEYVGHVRVKGCRVLDIGTASGFLTWEAEKRGAEVVSFDLDHARRQKALPFAESIYMRDRGESERIRNEYFEALKRGYWHAHRAFGSRAQAFYGDIENLPEALGRFDVAIFGSVLEHLPDHIQALASAARLSNTIVITGSFDDTEDHKALFVGWADHPEANYSFWRYTTGIYREVLAMLGFTIERVTRARYRCDLAGNDVELPTIVARRARP